MVLKDQKVAVVTGSSTGIGFETCLLLARNGIRTYATTRDLTKTDLIKKITEKEKLPLKVIEMNVNKDDSVAQAFKEISEDEAGEVGLVMIPNIKVKQMRLKYADIVNELKSIRD